MYHCKTCRQEFEYDLTPHELKLAMNPDLANKVLWNDKDWERSIGPCPTDGCYGVIEPGILPVRINICGDGDYCFVSESLAIHPDQISAHKKLFPDVGVHSDGKLEFHSVRSRERYCEKTGFVKIPQKIKQKGTTIA